MDCRGDETRHKDYLFMQVTKMALKPLDLQQTKDIETAVAGIRADKLKEKAAADAAKKGAPLAPARLVAGSLTLRAPRVACVTPSDHLRLPSSCRWVVGAEYAPSRRSTIQGRMSTTNSGLSDVRFCAGGCSGRQEEDPQRGPQRRVCRVGGLSVR